MKFHHGLPSYPGGFRFFRGTISCNNRADQHCYLEQPIRWWFGVSFGWLFIGVIQVDRSLNTRSSEAPQS